MTYFIQFITENGDEYTVFVTTDEDYADRVFQDLTTPPGYNMELRVTDEDIDTYTTCGVLRYDHSEF